MDLVTDWGNKMFKRARIKLTGWYLLIIMTILLAFSGVIYTTTSHELERFAEAQRMRFEIRSNDPEFLPRRTTPPVIFIDQELLEETKKRLLMGLVIIDLGILGIAGILGYYLSGKTLRPIREVMNEQYRFVSDASHELKTPITAIKTTLEVAIRDKKLTRQEAKETLKSSLEEVNRLQKLAEGLLELTHNTREIQLRKTDIAKLVTAAVKTIEPLAIKKRIIVNTKVENIVGMIDQARMERALVTILDNAIKYSVTGGKVMVAGKLSEKLITIQVIDHGSGIGENDVLHVFDRFYRTDPARSTKGYGLGLAIAKQIVEEQRGKIEITSTLGKGTKIAIKLPYSAKLQKTNIS
ncbi:MAG: integral membrane sensor signal transduction histidine kinase [uncultured bacterium]|nr:MAG: integral membrane sensor signal transduction histidine kinase [uncultured bacterium]